MKKKQKEFNALPIINNNIKWQIITCITLSIIIIVCFVFANNVVDKKKLREYNIANNIKLVNSIENISTENGKVALSGYAFISNKDSMDNHISLLICNVDTNKEIWFDIEQMNRVDVNSYFAGEYDYSNSGYKASTDLRKLSQDEIYEVIISIDYSDASIKGKTRTTVSTQQYILNNEIYNYNPKDFDKPTMNIESALLKEVFSIGQLCFYKKDANLYVYKYDDKLYWITPDNFIQEGETNIIYHLYTSQLNNLPEHRINHKFDNLDFYFEHHEYLDENTAPYRVATREIPKDYPIIYIKTGVYDNVNNKTIWTKSFHLKNIFTTE